MVYVMYGIVLIASIALIVLVTIQEGADNKMGAMGGNAPESLWGNSRSRSKNAVLKRLTIITAVVFFISTLALIVVH